MQFALNFYAENKDFTAILAKNEGKMESVFRQILTRCSRCRVIKAAILEVALALTRRGGQSNLLAAFNGFKDIDNEARDTIWKPQETKLKFLLLGNNDVTDNSLDSRLTFYQNADSSRLSYDENGLQTF